MGYTRTNVGDYVAVTRSLGQNPVCFMIFWCNSINVLCLFDMIINSHFDGGGIRRSGVHYFTGLRNCVNDTEAGPIAVCLLGVYNLSWCLAFHAFVFLLILFFSGFCWHKIWIMKYDCGNRIYVVMFVKQNKISMSQRLPRKISPPESQQRSNQATKPQKKTKQKKTKKSNYRYPVIQQTNK